jgi:hypothetical protein
MICGGFWSAVKMERMVFDRMQHGESRARRERRVFRIAGLHSDLLDLCVQELDNPAFNINLVHIMPS